MTRYYMSCGSCNKVLEKIMLDLH